MLSASYPPLARSLFPRSYWLLLLFLCLPVLATTAPDDIHFDLINEEDGLSQNSIFSLTQDNHGFIWIGTEDGLNRYDGKTVKSCTQARVDSLNLSLGTIYSILCDHQGRLWIGLYGGGLIFWDWASGTFHRPQDSDDEYWNRQTFTTLAMAEDAAGQLWISIMEGNGLYRYQPETGQVDWFGLEDGGQANAPIRLALQLVTDSRGTVWGVTYEGLQHIDPDGNCEYYPVPPGFGWDAELMASPCLTLEEHDGSTSILLGGDGGVLLRFDPQTRTYSRVGPKTNLTESDIISLHVDLDRYIWVGTENDGLYILDPKTELVTHLGGMPMAPGDLTGRMISTIFQSRRGLMWIGTSGSGLNKEMGRKAFQVLLPGQQPGVRLSDGMITSLSETDDGKLLIGTWSGGLNVYDPQTGKIQILRHHPERSTSLAQDEIMATLVDSRGWLWVATESEGISLSKNGLDGFIHLRADEENPEALPENSAMCLTEDLEGKIWIGTYMSGVARIDPASLKVTRYLPGEKVPIPDMRYPVLAIHTDHEGQIWVGTEHYGLGVYDAAADSFLFYRHDPDDPNSLSHNDVMGIYQDSKNRYWIGTYGGGLNRFDPETEQFVTYTLADGLPNNVVYDFLEDDAGDLWFGTNNGLCRFNPETEEIKTYNRSDGLPSNEFNAPVLITRDRTLVFGTLNGVVRFRAAEIRDNLNRPEIHFTDLWVNGHAYDIDPPDADKPRLQQALIKRPDLHLYPEDLLIQISFVAMDYSNPGENRYRYLLEGYQDEWIDLDTRNEVVLTSLPAGDYRLHVTGCNDDGQWSKSPAVLPITVHPPFYRTYLFSALIIILAIALIALAYRMRTAVLRRRTVELERINQRLNDEIQARELAQKEVEQRDSQFSAVIEQSPSAIALIDHDGNIVQYNQVWRDLWAVDEHETLLFNLTFRKADIALDQRIIDLFQAALRGESGNLADLHFPQDARLTQLADRHYSVRMFPLLSGSGSVAFVVLSMDDISDQIRAEKSLRVSEHRYRMLFEGANDAIFLMTREQFTICNREAVIMFGCRDERDLVGHSPAEFSVETQYDGRDSATAAVAYIDAALAGKPQRFHWQHCRRDGTPFHAEVSLNRLEVEGEPLIQAMVRDVTERRRSERALAESLREKEVLLKEVHHRVKNNLQIISSLINLQTNLSADSEINSSLAEIRDRVYSMALVHEELYQSPSLSDVRLDRYLDRLLEALNRSLNLKPDRVVIQTKVTKVHLSLELAIPFGLIINELVSNALKYAYPGPEDRGEIRIIIPPPHKERLSITVEDDGVGLPESFEIDSVDTLGLNLVRTIIRDQLQGDMEAGGPPGTRFKIRIPLS